MKTARAKKKKKEVKSDETNKLGLRKGEGKEGGGGKERWELETL